MGCLNTTWARCYDLGDEDRTIDVFELNARLHPQSIWVLHVLAGTYLNIGDHTNAKKVCGHVLEMEPEDEEVLKLLETIESDSSTRSRFLLFAER